jgi:DNA-binding SARP family transcriptional activator
MAILALDPGRCVSRDRLVDGLWGDTPPDSAGHSLQVHVSSVRKLLGADLIETCSGGYRLAVDPEAVDARRASDLVAAARAARGEGNEENARTHLRAALELFRGPPLADVQLEGQATHAAARLNDLRIEALEEEFDLALALGGGAALVAGLQALVTEEPLRERARAQLMLALYRSGRQADALAVFQDARRTFVEELGIEPSPALRQLERAILQQDETLIVTGSQLSSPDSRAPRLPKRVAAVGVIALAAAAGVSAALLLPPGHPRASSSTSSSMSGPSTLVATPNHAVRHRAPRRATVASHTTRKHVPAVVVMPVPPTTTTTERVTVSTTAKPVPHVTTYPTHTTVPPAVAPPTTTAPADPMRIVDTFDDAVPDATVWNVLFNGTGADAVQQDGKGVFSIAAGAQPGGAYNFVGAQYGTRCRFTGDIDTQVDYRLVNWPAGSSAYVSLQAVFADGMVERFSEPSGSDVYGSIIQPRFKTVVASGTTGSLRLTRVGGVLTTYYLDAGAWVPIDSASATGTAVLQFGLSVTPGVSPASNISVELDNFAATASGTTGC